MQKQITALDASIEEKNAAIAEKQRNIDEDVETLKERLCAIYMMGDASTLEILLQSESVIDMAQKVELLNIITEHDTKLIARLTEDMEAIAAERAEIEGEKEQVAAARGELESSRTELAAVQAEADRVLAELNQSVASVQAESDRIAAATRPSTTGSPTTTPRSSSRPGAGRPAAAATRARAISPGRCRALRA